MDCLGGMRMLLREDYVDFIVSSPPYFDLKSYATWPSYKEHLDFIREVIFECFRVLKPGSWICWNIQECIPFPPEGKRERYCEPLLADTIQIMKEVGFLYEKDIVWYKGKGTATQKLFGSFPFPSLILTSGLTEHIITARKPRGKYKRKISKEIKQKSEITKKEWADWAVDLWEILPASAKKVGHPAPYPVEIPYRLIRLNSFVEDIVLDPFAGSGTTAVAAEKCGRHYIGFEIHEKYVKEARNRIHMKTALFGYDGK
tara:strand:+ start:79 stop:852 length:774 start_codon:yes stop_codon:yes gene_type:complete